MAKWGLLAKDYCMKSLLQYSKIKTIEIFKIVGLRYEEFEVVYQLASVER